MGAGKAGLLEELGLAGWLEAGDAAEVGRWASFGEAEGLGPQVLVAEEALDALAVAHRSAQLHASPAMGAGVHGQAERQAHQLGRPGSGACNIFRNAAVLGFYPRQVDAAIALARAISNLFHIPLVLPKATSPTSTAGVTRGFDPRVAQGKFRGICGHYHLKASKIDPGVSLWQPMREAGFGVG